MQTETSLPVWVQRQLALAWTLMLLAPQAIVSSRHVPRLRTRGRISGPASLSQVLETVGLNGKRDRHRIVVSLGRLDPGDLDDLRLGKVSSKFREGRVRHLLRVGLLNINQGGLLSVAKGGTVAKVLEVAEPLHAQPFLNGLRQCDVLAEGAAVQYRHPGLDECNQIHFETKPAFHRLFDLVRCPYQAWLPCVDDLQGHHYLAEHPLGHPERDAGQEAPRSFDRLQSHGMSIYA